jgi:hypothetical protein
MGKRLQPESLMGRPLQWRYECKDPNDSNGDRGKEESVRKNNLLSLSANIILKYIEQSSDLVLTIQTQSIFRL